jgi:hypothetical protein
MAQQVDPRTKPPRPPRFAEANMGAMIGAIVGGVGGLFAIGLASAIGEGDVSWLFRTPKLSLICWLISGPAGWILGGQFGPRLGLRFRKRKAEIIGGVIGGLVPVIFFIVVGYYLDRIEPYISGI